MQTVQYTCVQMLLVLYPDERYHTFVWQSVCMYGAHSESLQEKGNVVCRRVVVI